jgi:hypothetical protein
MGLLDPVQVLWKVPIGPSFLHLCLTQEVCRQFAPLHGDCFAVHDSFGGSPTGASNGQRVTILAA